MHQDFTLTAADLLLRFRFPRRARSFIEFLAGFRYTDLDLTLQSALSSAHDELTGLSPAAGIGMGFRFGDNLVLDLRFLADLDSTSGVLRSRDLALSYWLSPSIALNIGCRQWRYDKRGDGESAVDRLVWSGFSGGLAFSF